MLVLDQGVLVTDANQKLLPFRARLFCVTADLPAVRKLLSFFGHSGLKGCSKCWKKAVREGKRNSWKGTEPCENRTHTEMKNAAHLYNSTIANSFGDKNHVAEYFCRWNPLYKLSYINMVTLHQIDPMHCLFLGIVKSHLNLLFTLILKEKHKEIETKIKVLSKKEKDKIKN